LKNDSFSIKNAYSCERRKDFITILGVCLFFFVVVFELYLVIWVPIQLKTKSMLEKDVAKQEMISRADNLRDTLSEVNTKSRIQEGEIALAKSAVDSMAAYIRENQDFLNRDQIREIDSLLKRYAELAQNWKDGKFIIKEERLDYTAYMDNLKAKAGLQVGN
jgi:hypothetical protein